MMSSPRTYCIFANERGVDESLPLLGRLVADPRRPLDEYRPRIDDCQQPSQTSPIIENFKHDISSMKVANLSTGTIKNLQAGLGLGTLLGLDGGADKANTYSVKTDELKTYSLQQVNDAWEALKGTYESDIKMLLEQNQGKAYFMVSLKTAAKSTTVGRGDVHDTSGDAKISVPLQVASGGVVPAFIGDPHVHIHGQRSNNAAVTGQYAEEVAFAAEYRLISLVSDYKFSLKKLISRQQLMENKGTWKPSGKALAFGADDDSDSDDGDDGDDSDEEEKFI